MRRPLSIIIMVLRRGILIVPFKIVPATQSRQEFCFFKVLYE